MKNSLYLGLFICLTITLVSFTAHNHLNESNNCTYECPEDELFFLSNTYEMRMNNGGSLMYLWVCDGNRDHKYWIKDE